MAPTMRDVQLTAAGDGAFEEVRLLDAYDEEDSDKLNGNLRRIQVRVSGMTCAACSNSVEQALMGVDGVFRASVALLQNKADVVFDPNLVKVDYYFIASFSLIV